MEDIKKIVIFGTGAVAAEITSQLEDSDWGEKIGIQIKGYVTSVKNGIENWHKYNYSSPYLGHFDDYKMMIILLLQLEIIPKLKGKLSHK